MKSCHICMRLHQRRRRICEPKGERHKPQQFLHTSGAASEYGHVHKSSTPDNTNIQKLQKPHITHICAYLCGIKATTHSSTRSRSCERGWLPMLYDVSITT